MKVVLQDLTKIFPARKKGGTDTVAVDHFTYEIPDGKLIGLLGPSGCGKSTTLYMISGLQTPTKGKIFFGDQDVTALPAEQRGVGLVFQNYALYPHLTVLQNIRFPLENLKGKDKLSKAEMNARAQEAAALVQIEGLLDRKPSELCPRCCCWMSRCPIWMPGSGCKPERKSAGFKRKPASPPFLSPTTRRRP